MKVVKIKKEKTQKSPWPQIPGHPYRILITGGSGSAKTNSLFTLISLQSDIDKIYSYAKDPFETKHQFLIKGMLRPIACIDINTHSVRQ